MKRNTQLVDVVEALRPPGRFPSLLHRGEQECHQNPDDRHDHQQLDQRKSPLAATDTPNTDGHILMGHRNPLR